jgi:hypothetical protein
MDAADAGGGMEILALSTLPPVVSGSAERPFLLRAEVEDGEDRV